MASRFARAGTSWRRSTRSSHGVQHRRWLDHGLPDDAWLVGDPGTQVGAAACSRCACCRYCSRPAWTLARRAVDCAGRLRSPGLVSQPVHHGFRYVPAARGCFGDRAGAAAPVPIGGMLFPIFCGRMLDVWKERGNEAMAYTDLLQYCAFAYIVALVLHHLLVLRFEAGR